MICFVVLLVIAVYLSCLISVGGVVGIWARLVVGVNVCLFCGFTVFCVLF